MDLNLIKGLCRLRLKAELAEDVENALEFFKIIDSIPCEDLDPLFLPIEVTNRFRSDEPVEFKDKDLLLKNCALVKDNFVVSPPLFKKK